MPKLGLGIKPIVISNQISIEEKPLHQCKSKQSAETMLAFSATV